jgi:propanediol utilization protein
MDIKIKNKIKHIINECIHTIFKNGYELKESKDLSNIGEIKYEWEYDEDDY